MDDNDGLIEEAQKILDEEYLRATRIDPRMRRFRRALADLGLPVPADWATADGLDSVDFGSLTALQFDRLVQLLEDIAQNRPIRVTIVRGGPSLFDPGAPSGPYRAPLSSSVHMVVPS